MAEKFSGLNAIAPLRTRFVEGMKALVRKPNAARSLPACLEHLEPAHIKQAKLLSHRMAHGLKQAKRASIVKVSPKEIEEMVFVGVCAGNHLQVMEIAHMVLQDPMSVRFRSKTLYLLLLKLVAAQLDSTLAQLSLNLFAELFSHCRDVSRDETTMATLLLFQCFHNCRDFSQLLTLKILFESIIVQRLPSVEYEARFIAANLHVLINSFQYHRALELMHQSFETFADTQDQVVLVQTFPVLKLLNMMCSFEDCDMLRDWLNVLNKIQPQAIPLEEWAKFLDLAVSKNHYGLTKLIYNQVIMAGRELLSVDDVLTSNVVADLEANSPMLATLSAHTLQAVLHTLSSHGDVALTLNLIEWHYIHREMRGESALTKELCIEIIRSYCCYNEEASTLSDGDSDASVERVLDVLESFIRRLKQEFIYTDISDAMSHKFNTLNIYDENVAAARQKELATGEYLNELNDLGLKARKLTNKNITASLQGNVLMNNKLLHQIITQHLRYMLAKHMSLKCIQIYIECILNHVNKYQNTSGLVSAMMAMKSFNHDLLPWLTPNVFNIAFKSISNSPAGLITGSVLYSFMKRKGLDVSTSNLEHLIYSSLAAGGSQFNGFLEYYLHEYLSANPREISPQIFHRIRNYSGLNDDGRRLLHFLEENTVESALQLWESYGFSSCFPLLNTESYNKEHYHQIDSRDAQYLSQVLGISEAP